MRFKFYEVVRVIAEGEYQNRLGVVRGISENDGIVTGYALAFGSGAVFFKVDEIESTGKTISEEEYFTGNWIDTL